MGKSINKRVDDLEKIVLAASKPSPDNPPMSPEMYERLRKVQAELQSDLDDSQEKMSRLLPEHCAKSGSPPPGGPPPRPGTS